VPAVPARVAAAPGSAETGDVVVRLVDLIADPRALARAESVLSADELVRARRGTPVVHRRRVLLRAALRSALGEQLGMDPAAVPLARTPTGRPYLAGTTGHPRLDASCSASGALGVVAVGRDRRVGIDVEAVANWSAAVLGEGWLSPAECAALARMAPADRAVAVTRSWTQKEAVLKARGTGLLEDPADIATPIGQPDGIVCGWDVRNVPVPDRWVASLAVGPMTRPDDEGRTRSAHDGVAEKETP
jgi:4'-phosphopantetheinyl transferase